MVDVPLHIRCGVTQVAIVSEINIQLDDYSDRSTLLSMRHLLRPISLCSTSHIFYV